MVENAPAGNRATPLEESMAHRLGTLIITAALCGPLMAFEPVSSQNPPHYEVYAVEYASFPPFDPEPWIPGVEPGTTVAGSYMVWLIKGQGGRNILVDTGFLWDVPNRENFPMQIEGYVRPDTAVARLGVAPEDVTDIVITHLHWDHADGIRLFPNAHVWIQKAELEYYATSAWQEGGDNRGVARRNVPTIVELNTEGRVTFVNGDNQEIFEGVIAYTGGRHSFESQYLGVNTEGGTVILASDNVWFYPNLDQNLANSLTFDPEAQLQAQSRMRELASKPEWIIPGHDRAVFDRFPSPIKGVARIR